MSLREGAKTALRDCMNVKEGETVLIVTDTEKYEIGKAFFNSARSLRTESIIITMKPRETNGQEPPSSIAQAMKTADVILAPTAKSLSHTSARHEACANGARVATLPGIVKEMMSDGGLKANYPKLERKVKNLAKKLRGSKKARITSKQGTDLTFTLEGREWQTDTGICSNSGDFTNLPGGEVFISPVSAEGKLVIDGSMSGLGLLDFPLTMEVEDGYVTNLDGFKADEMEKTLDDAGKSGRNIAELGIGMNEAAKLIGVTLEDEKVAGTLHVAVGDDSTIGGDNEASIHLDGLITADPKLTVDDDPIRLPERSS